jgi:hypothetical protein
LPVVAFDFAAQVTEHERAGRDHQKTEETKSVREAATEHGAGDQVQERQHDHLLVVRRSPARREPHHLQTRGELDGQLEQRGTQKEPDRLGYQKSDRRHDAELFEHRLVLKILRHGQRGDQPDHDAPGDPAIELTAREQRQESERRQRIGHHPVDQAESHGGFSPGSRAESGGDTITGAGAAAAEGGAKADGARTIFRGTRSGPAWS